MNITKHDLSRRFMMCHELMSLLFFLFFFFKKKKPKAKELDLKNYKTLSFKLEQSCICIIIRVCEIPNKQVTEIFRIRKNYF